MTRPRIVIMANNITELGGAQRIAHVLAQGLASRGYPVQLVGIAPKEPRHHYFDDPQYASVELLAEPLPQDAESRSRLRKQAVRRLTGLLADGEPGVVITTQVWCMEHLAEADHAGWRVIGQYHSSYEAAAAGKDLGRLMSAYADIDWFTLLTESDAANFRRHGMPHAVAMSNPLAYWPSVPASLDDPVVTYLGRLSSEKAPLLLLDAWQRIAPAHPSWRLQFVGSGPLQSEVVARGGERVSVVEPSADPESVLRASGVLALPSLVEGFPLALVEAMACGLAVVAADCSAGVRELVEDEATGLLATRGDASSLAAQLDRLLASSDLRHRLGAAARERVAAYRQDRILDRWEWLIAQTLR